MTVLAGILGVSVYFELLLRETSLLVWLVLGFFISLLVNRAALDEKK
jgi:hypothetical protein